jgi:hypothetical protein
MGYQVVYDGVNKHLKVFASDGTLRFQCEAQNDSVSPIAWRPDAGCPPGDYVLDDAESNDVDEPSTPSNDWIGEGRWFVPILNVPGHEGIGIHGGGTCVTPPDALALDPRQGWCPTLNCIRLQNEDLEEFVTITIPLNGTPIRVVQPNS